MPAPTIQFAHGVASGDPYADSVILWTRINPPDGLAGSLDVQWEIASSADFAPYSIQGSGTFTTTASRDWTVKVEAAGLMADSTYHYRFRIGDTVSPVGQTKTLPVGSDPVRLAVFSCANFPAAQQFDAYARAVAINSANPYDAWLQVGDYIYEYGPGGYGSAEDAAGSRGFLPNREILSLDDYRQRYAQYHTDPGLLALRAAAPLIAIWDDHETANDSWKGGAENHQSATEGDWIARRDAALKAYYEWIPIREPGQRQPSDGATASSPLTQGYRSFNFGDVLALHMLETRLIARDQQLQYPDAAAVQARIGAILADPLQVATYATRAGIAPPASAAAIPAFATALVPLVTQELVIATVQQAWGDPNRDLIGDSQLAWLQQQMATSTAAWQVLGQQVLMQSMAVPAELLLNAGDPALLDKYAAPLQRLATGTPFSALTAAEQALFSEAGKIPYKLDAWDGYGVERERILQAALGLGKRLISLAGDTHNAWAGVLDTMSAASNPAGTVAGVEFATPGVTSPGLEKYLPGADAYIRARYPAVDGLDGLFIGYVNGLRYADLNRRGFLDLSVSKEQAVGSFQFLNGTDPVSGQPLWSSETVVSSAGLALSSSTEAQPLISWQPGWRELDLVLGVALAAAASPTLLDPSAYASVPRLGVQLADVGVVGSDAADRIEVGVGSTIQAGAGDDELSNVNSLGGNLLVGGPGEDRFFCRSVADALIGGSWRLVPGPSALPLGLALADRERDTVLLDSSDGAGGLPLRILDFELGLDRLLVDGVDLVGDWSAWRQQLQALNVSINAAPQISQPELRIDLEPDRVRSIDLASLARDPDGDSLQLIVLDGPQWIRSNGMVLELSPPESLTDEQVAATTVRLGISDGKAVSLLQPSFNLQVPATTVQLVPLQLDQPEGQSGLTALRFRLDRSGDLSGASTVNWAVVGDGANPATAADFGGSLPSASTTFLPGESSKTIVISVASDTLVEADEAFVVQLVSATGAFLFSSTAAALGTIRNDDAEVRLSLAVASILEDSSDTLTYQFTRVGDLSSQLLVSFSVGGTAVFGSDYGQVGASAFAAGAGSVVFPAGADSVSLVIDPSADLLEEADETLSLTLTNGAGYVARDSAPLISTIINDDPTVTLALLSPDRVRENGKESLRFVFTRTGPTSKALSVAYAVGGTATAGEDYAGLPAGVGANRTLVFAAGASTAALTIDPVSDLQEEPDESISLRLLAGTGYRVGTPEAVTGSLLTDDSTVSLSLENASVLEDDEAGLVYLFSRSGFLAEPLTVTYSVAGTATTGDDYAGLPAGGKARSITFAAGQSSARLVLDPLPDDSVEKDETVSLVLAASSAYSVASRQPVVGTIRNDDATVSLSVSPGSLLEDGSGSLLYTFTRSGYLGAPLAVDFAVGGSAAFLTDYSPIGASSFNATSGRVTLASGSSSVSLRIDPLADDLAEANETVALTLSEGAGYSIGSRQAVIGTIANDDLPVISLSLVRAVVSEDGADRLLYSFSRSGPTIRAQRVNYSLAGTASPGSDFSGIPAAGGSIVIPAAASAVTLSVDPRADGLQEGDETVILTVAPGSGYRGSSQQGVVGTIRNDDQIGTAQPDVLVGTDLPDLIDGLAGRDTLTGGAGADVFRFRFGQSGSATPDRITDFGFATDRIRLLSARGSLFVPTALYRAADNSSASSLEALAAEVFADANGAVGGNQPLAARQAALVVASQPAIAGIYLLINDATAMFSSAADLLINITGAGGSLPASGPITPLGQLFATS